VKTQLETDQQLEIAVGIADVCSPSDIYAADVQLAQARALIAATLALQQVAAEIREARAQLSRIGHLTAPQPVVYPVNNPIEVREVTRPDRGPVTLALLVMAGTIVLLLVLCVVLALT
jgi:hypothetical protein